MNGGTKNRQLSDIMKILSTKLSADERLVIPYQKTFL